MVTRPEVSKTKALWQIQTSTALNNVHLMHAHLGHTSVSNMSHIHDTYFTISTKPQCEIFTLAKFHRLPFPVSSSIATAFFISVTSHSH